MQWQSSEELYHYGITGQKWGVRNYQNEDGTLTKAGIERYRRSTFDNRKESSNNVYINNYMAKQNKKQEKKEFKDFKIANKIAKRDSKGKKISKKELKLREKFEKKGMTKEQAEIAAYKKAKTQKFIKRASLGSLVGALAYFDYTHPNYKFYINGTEVFGKSTNYSRGHKSISGRGSKNYVPAFIDLLSGDPLGALLWL